MKENPDKIFDLLCNDCITGVTEKNITQRKTNVNYKKVWIVHSVANTNNELFSELDVFFRSVFDTFEEEDKSELKSCMKYSNIFLFYDITAESQKKVHACIIYNIEEYGSYISFIGVGGAFRNHGIGSFLLMLVQLHLKFERKKYNLYLISNKESEAFDFYKNRKFVIIPDDDKTNLPKSIYDDDTSMTKLVLSSLITKQMYYNYLVVFDFEKADEESRRYNLLRIRKKKDVEFDFKHQPALIFPFFVMVAILNLF